MGFNTQLITDYFNSHEGNYFFSDNSMYLKLHALFKCLEPEDLVEFYFSQSENIKLKNTILRFIAKNASKQKREYSKIVKTRLKDYSQLEYKKQVATRLLFDSCSEAMESRILLHSFNYFINSNRILERKLAYNVAPKIWKSIAPKIWQSLFENYDQQALNLVLKNSTVGQIVQNIQRFWLEDFPANYIKKQIIYNTRKESLEYFSFLISFQPTFYIEALSARNMPIPEDIIDPIIEGMRQKGDPLLFYYLGLTKDWIRIVSLLEEPFHKDLF